MTTLTDQQLLGDYAENRSEPAFAELVRRHVDLVYSAALRMVRDSHLAEDVTQGVFVALAKSAAQLTAHPVLSGWLHRTASNIAAQTVRTDVRRRAREQEAIVMNELLAAEPEVAWEHIAPELDAALGELDEPDRDAVLLRYFERKSAAEMGTVLGISDVAAQKRVSRAVDRLREYFAVRGLAVGADGLALVISAHSVQAAPSGLALTASTAALAGGTAATAFTTTVTTAIVMTTLQKTIIAAALAVAVGAGIYEAHQAATLRTEVQTLRRQQEDTAPLKAWVNQLQHERDVTSNQLAALTAENEALKKRPGEVLKLRGEVGQLRQENTGIKSTSPINKLTANPETRKMMWDQQKTSMASAYKSLSKKLKLTPEQTGQFNDLLADHIMDEVDRVTEVLRNGTKGAQLEQVFAKDETALQEKISGLLGPDGLAEYQKYTQDMVNSLTTDQFSSQLTGDKAEKSEKKKQLYTALQEETKSAVAAAGLPPDYQAIPMLNFANIASEEVGDRSLQLMEGVYNRVADRAAGFLSPEELAGFQNFKTNALSMTRYQLTINRKMMAPLAQ